MKVHPHDANRATVAEAVKIICNANRVARKAASRPFDDDRRAGEVAKAGEAGLRWFNVSKWYECFRQRTGLNITPEGVDDLLAELRNPAKRSDGARYDPTRMIEYAWELRCAVAHLHQADDEPLPTALACSCAGPILLAHALEIALKALQCRDREGLPPDRGHDLCKLFDALAKPTQERLLQAMPDAEWPLTGMDVPNHRGIRNVLRHARKAGEEWRYRHEHRTLVMETGELLQALEAILRVSGLDFEAVLNRPLLGNRGRADGSV